MTPLPAYHRSRPTASRVRHSVVQPPKSNPAEKTTSTILAKEESKSVIENNK
ncbi:MAG: hypothetical protein ACRC53_02725 [Plesiomonas sp.]|uniref:hypothetical protein n=1 Tax=Plesiomonas sp. TaxID=2486279 RepID=UPI003F372D94